MHIAYLFRHSKHNDEEIRYSLRSVARHAPWVTKVWIFGDKPRGVTEDRRLLEVVPHKALAWIGRYRMPVTNAFLLQFLVALLPDLPSEYLSFADDYILLADWTPELACRPRYLQDLSTVKTRGTGLFKDALWRTYDLLKRLDYPTLNYEAHVPFYLRKQWVLAAFRDFEDFITEDRFHGPLAKTAIMNHLRRRVEFTPISLTEEDLYAGFHRKEFSPDEIEPKTRGKIYLNFDDTAYNDAMRDFLSQRFPNPCRFEA